MIFAADFVDLEIKINVFAKIFNIKTKKVVYLNFLKSATSCSIKYIWPTFIEIRRNSCRFSFKSVLSIRYILCNGFIETYDMFETAKTFKFPCFVIIVFI